MDIEQELRAIVKKKLTSGTEIDSSTKLADAGLDSLDVVEIAFDVEDKFRIQLPPLASQVTEVTFKDLQRLVEEQLAAKTAGAPTLNYGNFLNTIISFLIVAFAVFLLVRSVNKWMPKPAPPVTTRDCPQCAMPIPVAAKKCGHCTSAV